MKFFIKFIQAFGYGIGVALMLVVVAACIILAFCWVISLGLIWGSVTVALAFIAFVSLVYAVENYKEES